MSRSIEMHVQPAPKAVQAARPAAPVGEAAARTHVLFLIPNLRSGGAQRVVSLLIKHLDRRRFRVSLAMVDGRDAVFRDSLPQDVKVTDLQLRKVSVAIPRLVGLIRRERPDVVFSTLDHLSLALARTRWLWPRGTRFIVRPAIMQSESARDPTVPAWATLLARYFYPKKDLIVFQSVALEADFRRFTRWKGKSGRVIVNPVDIRHIRAAAEEPPPDLPGDPNAVRLVGVGRVEWQKGFDLAIEALARLGDVNVVLTILGEGAGVASLEAKAAELGVAERVRFLGFCANPYPIMAKADALLLSSRYEGFPNVVLEALACGTPVVSTPVAGIHSILGDLEGCVVAEGFGPDQLAAALNRFASKPRRRIEPGAIDRFDTSAVVLQYEAALRGEPWTELISCR